MNEILEPWPWYVSGPLIVLVMGALIFSGERFGMSSNLRTLCAIGGGAKFSSFFDYNWRDQLWNLVVVVGAMLGGFFAAFYLSSDTIVELNPATINSLKELGMENVGETYLPPSIFSWESVFTLKGFSILAAGGFLIGFGTRYAGGCTSGHAISGLSNLQLPSLIAVIGFFIGGLLMTHLILPLIL